MKRLKKLLCLTLVLALLLCPAAGAEGGFTDVPQSHWAYAAITQAVDRGVVKGYPDGSFHPGEGVADTEFLVMVCRAFYAEDLERWEKACETMENQRWYMPAVYLALENDLLLGTSVASATAEDWNAAAAAVMGDIDRYDMAQIMYRVLLDNDLTASEEACQQAQASIGDFTAIPGRYQDAVSVCYALGVLTGMDNGTFAGAAGMSRAQGCVAIGRLWDCLDSTQSQLPDTQFPADAESQPPENAPPAASDDQETDTAQDTTQTEDELSAFRAEVVRLVNVERAKVGLSPLGTYDSLTQAAQLRSEEITQVFSHTRPDGSSCYTAMDQTGASQGAWTMGENIAAGQTTPAEVVASWMASEGHRANILGEKFTDIGVGLTVTEDGYGYYWVQMFAGR